MRRLDELTDQEVIAHLARAREPASLREIAHALELRHHGRRALQKIVSRLKRKGEIEEVHSGRFRLAGKKAAPSEARRKGTLLGFPNQLHRLPQHPFLGTEKRDRNCMIPTCSPVGWWRIATAMASSCLINLSQGWRAICLSAATPWATPCTVTTCSRASSAAPDPQDAAAASPVRMAKPRAASKAASCASWSARTQQS